MARYSIEDITLTNIADAIRNKTNKTDSIAVADMAEEIKNIVAGDGGDKTSENELVMRTATTYANDDVTSAGDNAFYGYTNLTSISLPKATKIGYQAFRNCSNLPSVDFPEVTSVNNAAFQQCSKLTTVNLPKCTSLGQYAFYSCNLLNSVSLPNVTSIGYSAFQNCLSLTAISLPACTTISPYAFSSCSNLASIYLSAVRPYYITCYLMNSNAFFGTGITATRGSIFVPASVVSYYKSATNWYYFSNRIFPYDFT